MDTILQDLKLVRGIAYFDPFDAAGNKTGGFDFGEVTDAGLTPTVDSVKAFSSRGGLLQEIRNVATKITREGTLAVTNISVQNSAWFIVGDIVDITQATAPVVDEAIAVVPGRWYQLGAATNNGTGVIDVSGVEIQDETDTTTYLDGTDFELDAANGRFRVISAGGIGSEILHADYTPGAKSWQQIQTSTAQISGELTIIQNNADGSNDRHVYPSVTLQGNGEMKTISSQDEYISMSFNIGINQKDANTPAMMINGQAA